MPSLRGTLVILATIPCCLLLFNDLVIKTLPPPTPDSIFHYDDVFKIVIFTPLQIWLVYSIDQKMKVCESFLSYLLVSIYAFGYGVNQSVNAIDSFLSRLQVANPRLKLNADVNAAIYFWDEKVGHIISSIAFFAFQIKWLAEINDSLKLSKTRTTSWRIVVDETRFRWLRLNVFGIFAGWTTGLVMIEGQCVELAIYADIAIFSFCCFIIGKLNTNSHVLTDTNHAYLMGYIWSCCIAHLLFFPLWHFYFGSFVEPTALGKCGWNVAQILTFGYGNTNAGPPCA